MQIIMKKEQIYFSPAVKVIRIENCTALCATSPSDSSSTERVTVSSNSYDDDDWE